MRLRHATAVAVAASALALTLTPARADAPASAGIELARALAAARPAAARVRVDAERVRRAVLKLAALSRRFPGSAEAAAADLEASRLLEALFRVKGRLEDSNAAREHLARVPGCDAALHAAELWAESGQDLSGAYRALRELARGNEGAPCGRAAAQSASVLSAFERPSAAAGANSGAPEPRAALSPRAPIEPAGPAVPAATVPEPAAAQPAESSAPALTQPAEAVASAVLGQPTIERIAIWPEGVSTRVAIYLDRPCPFVKVEQEQGVQIRIAGARIAPFVAAERNLPAGTVHSVRTLARPDGADVHVEVGGPVRYRLFPLGQPYRIVLDVARPEVAASEPGPSAIPEIHRIVIDAGHGGHDPGALGSSTRLAEKAVTLEIATILARLLGERLGLEVILTRRKDEFVPLEERTARANGAAGDLFVSIHANAAVDVDQAGVETFVLARSSERDALRIAARENRTDVGQVTELGAILATLGLQSHQAPSEALAASIQDRLVRRLTARFGGVQNRGVRRAMFYVLVGAHMPAVLVETSFLTNPTEEARLAAPEYRRELAEGIYEGIAAYVRGQ